jgi:hypothetical protein
MIVCLFVDAWSHSSFADLICFMWPHLCSSDLLVAMMAMQTAKATQMVLDTGVFLIL